MHDPVAVLSIGSQEPEWRYQSGTYCLQECAHRQVRERNDGKAQSAHYRDTEDQYGALQEAEGPPVGDYR